MKIGLWSDCHNYPSLPLMKLSAYHKQRGLIADGFFIALQDLRIINRFGVDKNENNLYHAQRTSRDYDDVL